MSCILMSAIQHAPAVSLPLLGPLHKGICVMRELLGTLVNNPVTAEAYIAFSDAVDNGVVVATALAATRVMLSLLNRPIHDALQPGAEYLKVGFYKPN